MPELPEVETIVRQLAPVLPGLVVREVQVLDARLGVPQPERARGRKVRGVTRRGKVVAIELGPAPRDGEGLWLCFHLRMTGRLFYAPRIGPEDRRRLRARVRLSKGSLWFCDLRRLGTMHLCRKVEEVAPQGVEPLSRELTARRLAELLGQSKQGLKLWLMRQDKVAGIGNIYAAEILFAAGLHPERPAGSLCPDEVRRLHRAIRGVLRRAIAFCGTTVSEYRDAQGDEGSFQNFLKVYGREGEPCLRCGAKIKRIGQQNRSTYFCPRCQR